MFEISRKDFEGSIERKIDYLIPFDQKLASQAAKLGKPLADTGKGSKTVAPLVELSQRIIGCAAEGDSDEGGKAKSGGTSLLGRFTDLKSLVSKKKK